MLNWYNTQVTAELGEIVDSGVDLWAFDYPVPRSEIQYNGKTCKVDFDKKTFEQKIIDHYRFRQIGQETVGRFLHMFRTRIREIMPYYVQVYEFDAKFRNIEDPLESYNLTETFLQETQGTGKVTGTNSTQNTQTMENTNTETSARSGTSEKTGTGGKLTKFSDTPQGQVSSISSGYLTNVTQEDTDTSENLDTSENGSVTGEGSGTVTDNGSGTSEQNTQDTGTTQHTLTRRGNIGVQPLGGEVLNIRSAFINIDMQIIDELKDLFLMVY